MITCKSYLCETTHDTELSLFLIGKMADKAISFLVLTNLSNEEVSFG